MTTAPSCILCTRDDVLARVLRAHTRDEVSLSVVHAIRDAQGLMQQVDSGLLLLDLTTPDSLDLAASVRDRFPRFVVVAIGMPRSEPALEAGRMGLYAVEDRQTIEPRCQAVVQQAVWHLALREENRLLRETQPAATAAEMASAAVPDPQIPFPDAFRHFGDTAGLFESLVEGVAHFAGVSRVALFTFERGDNTYRFRAGVTCLAQVRELRVGERDPLVEWLSRRAHVVSRQRLGMTPDAGERRMLQQGLDALGAELIIPLHDHEGLIGWLAVGHHVTGSPFDQRDIQNLVRLAEYVALMLDNARLQDEVRVQKTLAETVLHSVPVGIVASDAEDRTRWFNDAAQQMLGMSAGDVLNAPVRHLGSRLADMLLCATRGEGDDKPRSWQDPMSGRTLAVLARPLSSGGQRLGAVALIHDLTRETLLQQQQEQAARTSFWAELAAAMSHEVRNPLVAISTFAQLLPEHYADEEFRERFSTLVAQEIARLNGMVEQINQFANPPDLSFSPQAIDVLLLKAVTAAVQRTPDQRATVDRQIDRNLPEVWGDSNALVDCFAHLVANALEAVANVERPRVLLSATHGAGSDGRLCITIRDNGHGIAAGTGERVFSPFYTTKARGIGLGLPIARRTLTDHNGELNISSGPDGTTVTVLLPAYVPEYEYCETHSGC